jgi:hypothetical protein
MSKRKGKRAPEGVDVTVIRDWLGHASLDSTNIYARASLETKRKALEKVDPATRPSKARWKRDADLRAWLDSLYMARPNDREVPSAG